MEMASVAMDGKRKNLGFIVWACVAVALAAVGGSIWFVFTRPPKARPVTPSIPRWYPEPNFILDHEAELKLSIEQTRLIQVTSRSWELQRAAFDAQLKSFGSDVEQALTELKSQKPLSGDYAKVVADFDKARLKAWNAATHTLRPDQVLRLEKMRPGSEGLRAKATPKEVAMNDVTITWLPRVEGDNLVTQLIPLRPFHVDPDPIPLAEPFEHSGSFVAPPKAGSKRASLKK